MDGHDRAQTLADHLDHLGFDLGDGDLLTYGSSAATPSGLTAADIRRAFGRRRPMVREDAPVEEEDDAESFAARFPTESLYIDADDDDAALALDPDDPHRILGLASDASWDEVVAAHRELARVHHPDRHRESSPAERAEAEDRMSRVNVAYNTLRRVYGR